MEETSFKARLLKESETTTSLVDQQVRRLSFLCSDKNPA
jgi:hypothetical protein